MENKTPTPPQTPQNREQLLQSLQPLTAVPLDQLTDEQVNVLLERLTALKAQKSAAQKQAMPEKENDEKPEAPTQNPVPTPVHAPPSTPPIPTQIDDSVHAAILKKANEAETAFSQTVSGKAVQSPDTEDVVILPDPSCFEHLGDEPKSGIDYDPSMSTYTGTDTADDQTKTPSAAANNDYDTRPLSSDDMDEQTIAIYRDLVRKRRRQRHLLISVISVFVTLLFIIGGLTAYLCLYEPTIDDEPPSFWFDDSGDTQPMNSGDPVQSDAMLTDTNLQAPVITDSYARRENVYNFLVLGVDRAANLSDVIMVVSYDITEQNLHVLSLPRDTYINVGSSYHKLNAYFSASYNRSASRGAERYRDAIEAMASFIENGLCIRLDRYICMDTAGFREIIDAIGGVDMEVPFDMDYEDPEQELYIHLKAGYQHLDGEKAEQFVRYRSGYLEGDIGRISAQRLFITALANQVKTKLDLSSVVSIAKTSLQYVTTDLSVAEIGYFAKNAFSVDMDKVTFTTLPGGGVINPDTGASYYVMYAENVRKIVNEQFNVYEREITREVFLSNAKHFTNTASYISAVFLSEINDSGTVTAGDIQTNTPDIPHR